MVRKNSKEKNAKIKKGGRSLEGHSLQVTPIGLGLRVYPFTA